MLSRLAKWHTVALAAALYANSRYEEAKKRMDDALVTGLRNPVYFCQAARIAAALNDFEGARVFQNESLSLDPMACQLELPAAPTPEGKKR